MNSCAESHGVDKYLKKLGLTPNEIKVYLLLINSGPLTAKEISRLAKVPFSKIYLVLKSLEDKGWISMMYDRPLKYVALDPDEAIKRYRYKFEHEWTETCLRALDVLKRLYNVAAKSETEDVKIVKGEENITSTFLEMISRTQNELSIALNARIRLLFEEPHSIFEIERVRYLRRFRLVVRRSLLGEFKRLKEFGADLRCKDELKSGSVISDDREALIFLNDGERVAAAVWSTHSNLVHLTKAYFERLWRTSKTVKV